MSRTHLLVLLAIVALAFSSAVRAESTDTYFSVSAGFTRLADSTTGEVLEFEPASDTAVAVAVGSYFGDAARTELQVSYGTFALSASPPYDLDASASGFFLAANVLADLGDRSSGFSAELGAGVGWSFLDEACVSSGGARYCEDVTGDDWLVQAIGGVSWAIDPRNAVFGRYTLLHSGGFSAEDRAHMFMLGYRRGF